MARLIPSSSDPGFGVYVHWPFCASKCPYCDFNSHVRLKPIDEDRYVEAFSAEIQHRAALVPGRTVQSIFFGGGTPSLMQPQTVEAILRSISQGWSLAEDIEITLEANPTSVDVERFRGYRSAGVNRVSLGIQALNDKDLRSLGRLHTTQEALQALEIAHQLFSRVSFDLIYARPQQTPEEWAGELGAALKLAGEHLSLYQLTIEPETMFDRLRNAGKLVVPDETAQRVFWDITQELTRNHGLPAYEVSNHARKGGESRHNLIYWRYGDYAGIGPGAHGRLTTSKGKRAQATERHPEMWLTVVEGEGNGLIEDELLSSEEQGDEFLLMGLRLSDGIEPKRFEAIAGRPLSGTRIASLVADGMIEMTSAGFIRVTNEGFPVLDSVVADLAG